MSKELLRTRFTSFFTPSLGLCLAGVFSLLCISAAAEEPASKPADIIEKPTINVTELAARAASEGSPQVQRVTSQPFPTFAIWSDEKEVIWRDQNDNATKQEIIDAVTTKLNDYISTAAKKKSPFPAGTEIQTVWIERLMVRVDLLIPAEELAGVPIAPAQTIDKDQEFNDQVDWLAGENRPAPPAWLDDAAALGLEIFLDDPRLRSLKILAAPPEEEKKSFDESDPDFDPYDETSTPDYREVAFYHRFQPPIAFKPFDLEGDYGTTPEIPDYDPRYRAQPEGALTGATIFLSPGHGWLHDSRRNAWNTQRGPSYGVVEDLSNAEWVLQYLVPYLWNAGATVVTMRERNLNPHEVILDNSSDEGVSLEGDWTPQDADGAHSGAHMTAEAVEGPPEAATASVLYTPNIPVAGDYAVYVWYRRPLAESEGAEEALPAAQRAQYVINHSGGQTIWVQNQLRDGFTWKYIGTYHFEAGQNPETGSLRISNATLDGEGYVVADAVRFGGGMGTYVPPAPEEEEASENSIAKADIPTVSGYPRWEESGFYYSDFMGYDHAEDDFRGFNSVSAMPTHAEWEAERWEVENSLYFAWHTNASAGGKSRGLSSFVYGSEGWGPLSWFVGFPGGRDLQGWTHREVLSDVRADWARNWRDVKRITRWLGETNPNRNKKMAMNLIEVGFHDNPNDTLMILNPSFRRMTARAAYQGIVKYYESQVPGFEDATLLPEPPDHFVARGSAEGEVRLAWGEPPYDGLDDKKYGKGVLGDQATGYRVYHSRNGKGFNTGVALENTVFELDGLEPGLHYFKVTATNTGGESLPSETLAVQIPKTTDAPSILLVASFDRFDKGLNTTVEYKNTGRTFERGIISLLNSRDYLIQHAEAIAAAGDYNVDSISDEAVANVSVSLDEYDIVMYQFGRESTGGVLSEGEQLALHLYLNQGGALFISGGDVAWALDAQNTGRAFHRLLLRGEYAGDDAGSFAVSGMRGTAFEELGEISLEDGEGLFPEVYDAEQGAYIAAAPDFLKVVEGSQPALRYVVEESATAYDYVAALQYEGTYRLLYFAFPFETIEGTDTRNRLMTQTLEYLLH